MDKAVTAAIVDTAVTAAIADIADIAVTKTVMDIRTRWRTISLISKRTRTMLTRSLSKDPSGRMVRARVTTRVRVAMDTVDTADTVGTAMAAPTEATIAVVTGIATDHTALMVRTALMVHPIMDLIMDTATVQTVGMSLLRCTRKKCRSLWQQSLPRAFR